MPQIVYVEQEAKLNPAALAAQLGNTTGPAGQAVVSTARTCATVPPIQPPGMAASHLAAEEYVND